MWEDFEFCVLNKIRENEKYIVVEKKTSVENWQYCNITGE